MKDVKEINMKKKHNLIDLLSSNNKIIIIPKTYTKKTYANTFAKHMQNVYKTYTKTYTKKSPDPAWDAYEKIAFAAKHTRI